MEACNTPPHPHPCITVTKQQYSETVVHDSVKILFNLAIVNLNTALTRQEWKPVPPPPPHLTPVVTLSKY